MLDLRLNVASARYRSRFCQAMRSGDISGAQMKGFDEAMLQEWESIEAHNKSAKSILEVFASPKLMQNRER